MEKNLIMYKIWPGLGEAVCTHPQAFLREFFYFSFKKTEDFHA